MPLKKPLGNRNRCGLNSSKRPQTYCKSFILVRILKNGGRALFYVWAFEQETSRRIFEGQDVLVSWNIPKRYGAKSTERNNDIPIPEEFVSENDRTYERYYHMFVKGELEDLIVKACPNAALESGYHRDNWYCIATKTQ